MPKKKNSPRSRTGATSSSHINKAYMNIRQMLFHKEIGSGQKIACRDLANRLGMSPTPVIQALKWLEFQGLVRHEPERGYYTEPFSLEEVEEIYELRELVEVSLLPGTLQRLDDQGIGRLQAALDAHLSAAREIYLNGRLITDMEFHLTLASLSGRHLHQRMLRNLFDLLYLKYRGSFLSVRPMEYVDSEHRKIFESVVSRDLQKSRETLSQHVSGIKRDVLMVLRRMIEEKERSRF
jgi:DNA-binding GntR family transcriptional regulator